MCIFEMYKWNLSWTIQNEREMSERDREIKIDRERERERKGDR